MPGRKLAFMCPLYKQPLAYARPYMHIGIMAERDYVSGTPVVRIAKRTVL